MEVRMKNLASLHPFINAKFDTSKSLGKEAKAYFCTDCGGDSLMEDVADVHKIIGDKVIRAVKETADGCYCYKHKDIEKLGEQVFDVHGIQPIQIRVNKNGTIEYGYIIKPLIIPRPESVEFDNEKSIKDEVCLYCKFKVKEPKLYCSMFCKVMWMEEQRRRRLNSINNNNNNGEEGQEIGVDREGEGGREDDVEEELEEHEKDHLS